MRKNRTINWQKFVIVTIGLLFFCSQRSYAQPKGGKGNDSVPSYINPVIHQDYSDPDAIRVGDTYVMTASSFNQVPGLPILTSKDLVHWKLRGHALKKLVPEEHFKTVRHGCGVWAPAIRYHRNQFYIYYPDPDFGIYMITAKNYEGPWSSPLLMLPGKGYIDPCPFWDEDGQAYLIHAYAGSRTGIKSILTIRKMNPEGTAITDEGRIVYDGHGIDPTIEGPKMYKKNGYYYLFAPAGGVSTGWQTVLRSKNIYGPYERKVVMAQGNSNVNGPHQGAWVQGSDGKDWFLHFQDKNAYGRVVHLQPMTWKNNWPVIGEDQDGNGIGTPVNDFPELRLKSAIPFVDSFKFKMKPEWQWQANPETEWSFLQDNRLRLYAVSSSDSNANKYNLPNLLLQKFPEIAFQAGVTLHLDRLNDNEDAGLMVFGTDYAWIGVQKRNGLSLLVCVSCKNADKAGPEALTILDTLGPNNNSVYLRLKVNKDETCSFSYAKNGKHDTLIPAILKSNEINAEAIKTKPGKWIGAKLGIFATGKKRTNDCGSVDFEMFEINY